MLRISMLFGIVFSCALSLGCAKDSTNEFAKQIQAQEDAVVKLTQLGGKINTEEFKSANKDSIPVQALSVDLSTIQITPDVLDQLAHLKSVGAVNLSKSSITDNQIAELVDRRILGTVAILNLSHTAITDQALAKLVSLGLLRELNLVDTQVTEQGVARFKEERKANPTIPKTLEEPKIQY